MKINQRDIEESRRLAKAINALSADDKIKFNIEFYNNGYDFSKLSDDLKAKLNITAK